jgi:hypothetical protein
MAIPGTVVGGGGSVGITLYDDGSGIVVENAGCKDEVWTPLTYEDMDAVRAYVTYLNQFINAAKQWSTTQRGKRGA